jgi:hypothetical protein
MHMSAWAEDQKSAINPLRLAYINGSVSFWRYGAEDWVEARINTPLISGDALYTDKNSDLEIQAEGRAFIRADDNTQISIVNQTPDFLQLKVTTGRVSLDLRTLPSAGYTIELDTPNAVFTIDHIGYYRVDVDGEVHFITRRGGRAAMTPAGGGAMILLPSEETVVHQGADMAKAEVYAAPELDDWDQWNFDRTNNLIDAISERYLSSGIAGAHDLDYYGNWRLSDEYGPVWVPDGISSDWAPYSTGRWVWDSDYQWTWIDDAPWGWAPFHYGRWVYFGGYWAWAPGPVALRRPVYAPALVAFFGSRPGLSVGVGGLGGIGWVALGWGEPLIPWWGQRGFIGQPWWGGWGGPRMINNIVVRQMTVVNVNNISYTNRRISNALVATTHDQFGRGHIQGTVSHIPRQEKEMEHIRGALPMKPNSSNLVSDALRGLRPPEQVISRPVIATRHPQEIKLPWRTDAPTSVDVVQRYVPAPKPSVVELRRPVIGTETGPERARPQLPQPYKDRKGQIKPISPSSIDRTDSISTGVLPTPSATPSKGRDFSQPSTTQSPIVNDRRQQTLQTEDAKRSPIRNVSPIEAIPPRGARELTMPAPTVTPPVVRVTPQERQRELSRNVEVKPQLPQEPRIKAIPQAAQPHNEHKNLPGEPANSTYGGVNRKKYEREFQQY